MTVFVNYDEHPKYAGMWNRRLEKISEGEFLPKFQFVQSIFFEVLGEIGADKFEQYFNQRARKFGAKFFEFPTNDFLLFKSLQSEFSQIQEKANSNTTLNPKMLPKT